ncbi:outer membrane protein [Adhaeribacter aerolatus]|uniref:Outer membrane protein n=1 Tax=Adhaeribacter aerolatus TaxID=670289 RepID=A0A512AUT6_9BACT|nr:RagB/SusD family nutrient uptake outer membrane protein [Adhaeribacter aerolatus]GEO03474.1 outer membrane protein [Adhaeribacter aerolatus]
MKKIFRFIYSATLVLGLSLFPGCQGFLEEEVFTEFAPDELLQTEDGINRVLIGAYSELRPSVRDYFFTLSEFPTDITLESGGGFEREAVVYMNFQWDPSHPFFQNHWASMYRAVRNANALLDNIGKVQSIPTQRLAQLTAEAQFIRAAAYLHLYDIFGPVPLVITTNSTDLEPAKPTNDEFVTFLAKELRSAADNLPVQQALSGKATKGAALAVLCKLYLNTKQWQPCADVAKEIMDLNTYALFGQIENLFSVANENNKEYIYLFSFVPQPGLGNVYMPHAFPPNYPIQANWINYGAQFRTYTAFVKSFHSSDRRLKMIITQYTDTKGANIRLLEDAQGKPLDNARSFKYTPDPNAAIEHNGNDIPYVRYADILLSRAEALNEIQGPNAESVSLLKQIRDRAGVPVLQLADFPTKEAFRNHILQERGWEFFTEGKRREDLIRHGKFISSAVGRGKAAKPYHVLYPIPQREIEANANLEQNEGYR